MMTQYLRAELYHNESNRFDFSLQRLTAPLLVINTLMYIYLSVMYMIDFAINAPWGSGTSPSYRYPFTAEPFACLAEILF